MGNIPYYKSSRSYKNKSLNSPKDKKIKESQDRADERQKKVQDSVKQSGSIKEMGFAVSGAIRDASMYCINHPDWSKDMSNEDRFEWIDKVTKDLLTFRASSIKDYYSIYLLNISQKLYENEELENKILGKQKQEVVEPENNVIEF